MRARWSERRSVFTRRAGASSSRNADPAAGRRTKAACGRLFCFSGSNTQPSASFLVVRSIQRQSLMIKAGIVGGTGYTGVELLRLLAQHPQVELSAITSRKEAGTAVSAPFPGLRGRVALALPPPDSAALKKCDVVFFATPNGVAMGEARALLDAGARVIDISADF